jgi:hypothetical protein
MASCIFTGQNTGTDCTPLMRRGKQIILVPLFDNTGVRNCIDLSTATLDAAYFTSKVEEADASKRWYPLPILEDVNIVRGDSNKQTFESGRSILLNKGAKTLTATGLADDGHSQILYGKIDSEVRCQVYGVFTVDLDKNLIGLCIDNDNTKLYPAKMDKGSWDPIWTDENGSATSGIAYNFNYDVAISDGNFAMIAADEMTTDILGLAGLLDVLAAYAAGSATTTTLTGTLTNCYGTKLNPIPVEGLAANLEVYNVTTAGVEATTSITETSPGVYLATYTGTTTIAEVVQFRMIASPDNGLDGATMLTSSIATV